MTISRDAVFNESSSETSTSEGEPDARSLVLPGIARDVEVIEDEDECNEEVALNVEVSAQQDEECDDENAQQDIVEPHNLNCCKLQGSIFTRLTSWSTGCRKIFQKR